MRQSLFAVLIFITITFQINADNNKKIDPPNVHSLGLGISTFTSYENFANGKIFADMTIGFSGRLKFGPNLGIILNVLACDPLYFYENPSGSGNFYSTNSWASINAAGESETSYLFKQSEYLIFPDVALFIPISVFQPYLALGPALDLYLLGSGYKNNVDGFKDWYDALYGGERLLRFGWNVKAGIDLFLGSVSFGIELNFLTYDLSSFFKSVTSDSGYLIRNCQVSLTSLLWIF
jgi:hypothetical protein